MGPTDETRAFAGGKIALLGLFVAGLLIARLMVMARSGIILSGPIELPHAGLSVSIPVGNGWTSEKQWQYLDSTFLLSSSLVGVSGSPIAWAHCQYLLAAETKTVKDHLEGKAAEVEGNVVKTGRIRAGEIAIEWAQITKPQTLLTVFFGTARLPDARQFEIEVSEVAGETAMAERAFRSIVGSLRFRDGRLLEAGARVVSRLKSKGLSSFLETQDRQDCFFMNDAAGHTIGFAVEVLVDSGSQSKFNIQGASFLYISGPRPTEHVTSFQSDNSLGRFAWKSERTSGAYRSGAGIIFEGGRMTVSRSDRRSEGRDYLPSSAAIPDILVRQLLAEMLDSDTNELVVDLIEADGQINPIWISRSDGGNGSGGKEPAYVLRAEPLNNRGLPEQIYLDGDRQVVRRSSPRADGYTFERADSQTIARKFPEQAHYLLKMDGMRGPDKQQN